MASAAINKALKLLEFSKHDDVSARIDAGETIARHRHQMSMMIEAKATTAFDHAPTGIQLLALTILCRHLIC